MISDTVPSTKTITTTCPCCAAESRNLAVGEMVASYGCGTELMTLAWLPGKYIIKQSDKCRIWELEEYVSAMEGVVNMANQILDEDNNLYSDYEQLEKPLKALKLFRKAMDTRENNDVEVAEKPAQTRPASSDH